MRVTDILNPNDSVVAQLGNYVKLSIPDGGQGIWGPQGDHDLGTATGLIRLRTLIYCTAGFTTALSTLKLLYGSTTVIGTTLATDLDTGEWWYNTAPSTVSAIATATAMFDHVMDTSSLIFNVGVADWSANGGLDFHWWWTPLSVGAAFVAGTGEPS